jgi:hypothetical protein
LLLAIPNNVFANLFQIPNASISVNNLPTALQHNTDPSVTLQVTLAFIINVNSIPIVWEPSLQVQTTGYIANLPVLSLKEFVLKNQSALTILDVMTKILAPKTFVSQNMDSAETFKDVMITTNAQPMFALLPLMENHLLALILLSVAHKTLHFSTPISYYLLMIKKLNGSESATKITDVLHVLSTLNVMITMVALSILANNNTVLTITTDSTIKTTHGVIHRLLLNQSGSNLSQD